MGFLPTLFLMGLLASRKPCQIIIIQLLSGTPVVASTSPSAPLLLTLAGEVFFLLGKLQIKNLAVWPCPACSSKSLAALPDWWSFYTIALSLAIHIYTLANKKGICKIIFFFPGVTNRSSASDRENHKPAALSHPNGRKVAFKWDFQPFLPQNISVIAHHPQIRPFNDYCFSEMLNDVCCWILVPCPSLLKRLHYLPILIFSAEKLPLWQIYFSTSFPVFLSSFIHKGKSSLPTTKSLRPEILGSPKPLKLRCNSREGDQSFRRPSLPQVPLEAGGFCQTLASVL